MTNHLDGFDVLIDCNCRKQFKKTIRELKGENDFSCPFCGLTFHPVDFRAEVERREKAQDDFIREIMRT